MPLSKQNYVGDVTALTVCVLPLKDPIWVCMAGMGPALHVYNMSQKPNNCLLQSYVFEGARVHGFALDSYQNRFVVIYGDRFAKVLYHSNISLILVSASKLGSGKD